MLYLNEQKVCSFSDAAVLADEYVLTHKTVFPPSVRHAEASLEEIYRVFSRSATRETDIGTRKFEWLTQVPKRTAEKCACFYCLDPGHFILYCSSSKGVSFVQTVSE